MVISDNFLSIWHCQHLTNCLHLDCCSWFWWDGWYLGIHSPAVCETGRILSLDVFLTCKIFLQGICWLLQRSAILLWPGAHSLGPLYTQPHLTDSWRYFEFVMMLIRPPTKSTVTSFLSFGACKTHTHTHTHTHTFLILSQYELQPKK
jgi:hypothetical protein